MPRRLGLLVLLVCALLGANALSASAARADGITITYNSTRATATGYDKDPVTFFFEWVDPEPYAVRTMASHTLWWWSDAKQYGYMT